MQQAQEEYLILFEQARKWHQSQGTISGKKILETQVEIVKFCEELIRLREVWKTRAIELSKRHLDQEFSSEELASCFGSIQILLSSESLSIDDQGIQKVLSEFASNYTLLVQSEESKFIQILNQSKLQPSKKKDVGNKRGIPQKNSDTDVNAQNKLCKQERVANIKWCAHIFIYGRQLGGRPICFDSKQQCNRLVEILTDGFGRQLVSVRTKNGCVNGTTIPFNPAHLEVWLRDQSYFSAPQSVFSGISNMKVAAPAPDSQQTIVAYQIFIDGKLLGGSTLLFSRHGEFFDVLFFIRKITTLPVNYERKPERSGKILTREALYNMLKSVPGISLSILESSLGARPSSKTDYKDNPRKESVDNGVRQKNSDPSPGAHPRPWEWAREDGVTHFNPFDYK
ncbi:hypothetical protein DAERI_140130 [Deinococcus aerius]|uniref:Uncharacterized protein n=1 Tax=Deinococcus aerius TaxID=200253 RepID=A0A2I9CZ48_9DEIO|nr:hypothetical protein DAERI_140130 [Deinococcus aerius]